MNPFNLDIKHRLRVDSHAIALLNVIGEFLFIFLFDADKLLHESFVISKFLNLFKLTQIRDPSFTNFIGIKISKGPVTLSQPSSWCNAIGFIGEFFRIYFIKISEKSFFNQITVHRCHTIDFMSTHNSQMCHVYNGIFTLSHDRHSADFASIFAKFDTNFLQEPSVDFIDNLQMPWQ